MSARSHIAELQNRHFNLEKMIEDELNRPNPDEVKLGELKRKKLHLKDQIERLRSENSA